MSLAALVKIAETVGIILGAIGFALVTYWKLKEKAFTRVQGLSDNPERCKDHEDRLRDIEKDIGEIKGDIKAIKVKMDME